MNKQIKKMLLVMMFFLIIIPTGKAFANEVNEMIRVKITYKYDNVDNVPISNNLIAIGYATTGEFVFEKDFQSTSGFVMSASNKYYVTKEYYYATYNEANQAALALTASGTKALPVSIDNKLWTVYCGGYDTLDQANQVTYTFGGVVVYPNGKRTELTNNAGTLFVCDNSSLYVQIAPLESQTINLADRKYRGKMEFYRMSEGITPVNVLLLEEYLYGVVPSEVSYLWHIEVIKAQAVAARTYALQVKKHEHEGCDLCDCDHCQVYKGFTSEHPTTTLAVNETMHQKMYYNGELIQAYYFSSSGGYTENSEDVWTESVPYLRAVPDIYEINANEWTRTFTSSELEAILSSKGINIGNVTGLRIDEYSDSGRVRKLTIVGTNGTKTLEKSSVRSFFSPILGSNLFEIISDGVVAGDMVNIRSNTDLVSKDVATLNIRGIDGITRQITIGNNVQVLGDNSASAEYSVSTKQGASNTFVLNGKGAGHGIGLSQQGGKSMAEMGFTYKEILQFYYSGIVIQ